MADNKIEEHLEALKKYVNQLQNGDGSLDDIRIKKKQLSAIGRTIRQLEKNNIPVPESLNSEKLTLVSEINQLENASNGCLMVYESLKEVIFQLGGLCHKTPHKDLYQMSKKWRSQATPRSTLRKYIQKVLEENNGSAREDEVFDYIESHLDSRFTPADLSRPGGKNLKWQNNTRRERKAMIKEGVLTEDSKGKTWTLNQ